jgi:hypothetical protein
LESGFVKGEKGYYPCARLAFKNADPKRHYNKNIKVHFVEISDAGNLLNQKTFLHLKPGQEMQRSYANPKGLSWPSPDKALRVQVYVSQESSMSEALDIERREFTK